MAGAWPRVLLMKDNAFDPLGFGTHHPAPSLVSPSPCPSPWKLPNDHPHALAPIPLLELV